MYKPNKGASLASSALDRAAANPYLAYAMVLAAGLNSIENELELPEGAEDDVWSLTDRQRQALGISPLPRSLGNAIDLMENSQLVAETLGEHVFEFFLRNKQAEYDSYRGNVSEWELRHNLPAL